MAEELVFGEIANGATSDLRHANAIARRMVKEFGMSQLGKIYFRESGENPFLKGSGWLKAVENTAKPRPAKSIWKFATSWNPQWPTCKKSSANGEKFST